MNKSDASIKRSKIILLVISIISLYLGVIVTVPTFADTNNPIANKSPVPDSANYSGGGDFTPYTGVGRGDFDGNYSWAKIYVPMGQDATITIDQACIDLNNPSVNYSIEDLTNLEKEHTGTRDYQLLGDYSKPSGGCSNTVKFHIPANHAGTKSDIKGHTNFRVFGFIAQMQGVKSPGSAERYFRVSTDHGKVGIATPIDFDNGTIPPGQDYYSVYNNSGTWDYSVIFAPRCEAESGEIKGEIKVFDADNGNYQSGMDAILEKSPRNSGSLNWQQIDHFTPEDLQDVKSKSDPKWGNSGTTGVLKIQTNKKYIYKFTVRQSTFPNTIQLRIPFDELDGDRSILDNKGCEDWKLNGSTSVNKNPVHDTDTTATFSHSIKNSDTSDTATYSWKVQAKYINANGSVRFGYDDRTVQDSDGTIDTAGGNKRPDDFQTRFKFSDVANPKDGDKYCQRIQYTNANGPDTGTENSTQGGPDVCVRLDVNNGDDRAACKYLDVYNGGAYNDGQDHNARTEVWGDGVTISKVNGNNTPDHKDIGDTSPGGDGEYAPDANGSQQDQDKTWNYIPYQPDITITRQRQWHDNKGWHATNPGHREYYNGHDWVGYDTSKESAKSIHCYKATCTVSAVGKPELGNAPNKVLADQDYTVSATITNTGGTEALYLPELYNGQGSNQLALIGSGGSHPVGEGVNIGDTKSFTFTLHAPSNASVVPITVHPGYTSPGTLNRIGPDCPPVNVSVYEHFTLTPTAKSQPAPGSTAETPANVSYNGKVQNSESSVAVTAPASSSFYKKPIAGGQLNLGSGSGGTYAANTSTFVMGSPVGAPTADGNYVVPIGSYTAGDQFCAITHLTSFSSGWVGPGGDAVGDSGPSDSPEQCFHVVNQPYVHFSGSDVSAGGGFGLSCDPNESKGNIFTYNESPSAGGQAGAGVQFGAEAANIISGLGSANLRSSAPTGLSGLTFANSGFPNDGSSSPNKTYGGYLGGTNLCVPDYFNSDKPSTLAADTASASVTAGTGPIQQYYKPASGTLDLNPTADALISNATNQTIFVEGDVTIKHNITYSTAARTAVNQVPSFYLIVKGNIHIDPGVTQLDGVYVAQPNPTVPGKGVINTCISTSANIYDTCKNQLVINGAFVANKVFLTRSYSSLRYSQNGEHSLGGYNSGTRTDCGVSGKDIAPGSLYLKDCAAEIFNFTPELYMSQPALNPRYGPSSNKYDAITSLSPVL